LIISTKLYQQLFINLIKIINVFEEIEIKHIHPELGVGLQNIRAAWLLTSVPVKLTTSLHRGNLIYRWPGTGKRISYQTLKKGLIKKKIIIQIPFELLPF
jgi:hypothetical protein